MMKMIIFGYGQGGRMAARWLPAGWELLAYADNRKDKWGIDPDGIPVIDPALIPEWNPDLVWITVLNKDAARSIKTQLLDMGYRGEIHSLELFRRFMDLRLCSLRLLAEEIKRRELPGAVAELGVYQGAFAAEINRLFPDRTLYLFDTFSGFSQEDLMAEREHNRHCRAAAGDFSDTSAAGVLARLPYPERAVLCEGVFPDTLPQKLQPLAFVSLDPDLYAPTLQGLRAFWPHMVPGGVILIHDYNSSQFEGVGKAVRTFCREEHLMILPLCDLHGSAILLK